MQFLPGGGDIVWAYSAARSRSIIQVERNSAPADVAPIPEKDS